MKIVSIKRERRLLKPIASSEFLLGSIRLKAGIKPAYDHKMEQQTDWP